MKKRMSRLVLALLVLAMVCAMVPAALAEAASTPTLSLSKASDKVFVGDTVSFPTVSYDGGTVTEGVSWTLDSSAASTPDTSAAGTKTYTVSYTPSTDGTTPVTATYTLYVVEKKVTSFTALTTTSVTKAKETAKENLGLPTSLEAVYGSGDGTIKQNVTITGWTVTKDGSTVTYDGSVGAYTFTPTTALAEAELNSVAYPTVTVTIIEKPTFTIGSLPATTTYVKKGDTKTLTVSVPAQDGVSYTYQWYQSGTSSSTGTAISGATTASLTIPSTTKGTFYYYCAVKATKNNVESDVQTSGRAQVVVRDEYEVELTTSSSSYGTSSSNAMTVGTYVNLTAKVTRLVDNAIEVYSGAPVTWDNSNVQYASVSGNGKTGSNGTASGTFTAIATNSASTAMKVTAKVSVLGYEATLDLYIKPATAQAITYSTHNGGVEFNASDFLNAVDTAANVTTSTVGMDYVQFGSVSSTYGKLYRTSNMYYEVKSTDEYAYYPNSSQYDLDDVYFVPKTTSKVTLTYTAYTEYYAVLATGTVVVSGTSSDIEYQTSYGQSVTFDEDDFDDFFTDTIGRNAILESVMFDVDYDDDLNTRTYGYLYESTDSKADYVSKRSEYYYGATSKQDDLDTVTFTAGSYTKKYTITIPFTAYGYRTSSASSLTSAEGYVTITVNDGTATTIYSVGTDFEKLVDAMIPDGYTTGSAYKDLSVYFTSVTGGRLYYDYDSIADATEIDPDDDDEYFFYPTGKKELDLEKVYFVPAAGETTAKVTYTVYDGSTKVDTASLTFTIVQQTKSNYFNDVTENATGKWSANAIDFMSYNSLVTGTGSKIFSPEVNMDRAMLVTILYRIEGEPTVSNVTNPFTDVKKGSYYYNAVLWAYKNDIVNGTTKTTFSPSSYITREQIASILYRYAGSPKTTGTLTGFTDKSQVSSYATTAMAWAVKNGIITGTNSAGTVLSPTGNGTRAQVAVMLHRYLTR